MIELAREASRERLKEYVDLLSSADAAWALERLAGAERKVTEVMLSRPLSIRVDTPLQSLVKFFDDHAIFGAPLVLDDGRLVGVVKRSATREAMAEPEVGIF